MSLLAAQETDDRQKSSMQLNLDNEIHKRGWVRLVIAKGKWYLLSSLFTKGLGLLLLPVYTRYLSPADFGVLNSLQAMAQLLPIFMSLYLDAAFSRFYHEDKRDLQRLKALFSTVYWFVLAWGAIVLALTLATAPVWASQFVDVPYYYIVLAFVPALFLQIGQLGVVFLRQSLDSRRTTFLDVATALISIAITIPLLVRWELGVLARLIGGVFPALFLFAYYTWFFSKRGLLGKSWDSSLLKQCLFFSIPLIPNIASGWIVGMSDRLILAKYANAAAVGLYSLAMTFSSLLYLIQDAVTQVTGAASMSGLVHDKAATLKKIAQISLFLWAIMLTADLAVVLLSPEIVAIFATKDYANASALIGVCGFAYVLSCQYRIFSDIVSLHKKTWVISSAGFIMAGTSLALNLVLVPRWGFHAAAYTFVVSVFMYTAWIYLWAMRCEQVEVFWFRMTILVLVFVIGCWLSVFLNGITLSNLLFKLLIIVLFAAGSILIVKSAKT